MKEIILPKNDTEYKYALLLTQDEVDVLNEIAGRSSTDALFSRVSFNTKVASTAIDKLYDSTENITTRAPGERRHFK